VYGIFNEKSLTFHWIKVGDFLTVKRLCTLSPKQGTSNIFPLFVLGFVLHRSHLLTAVSYIEETIRFSP
jgi:hypothetical protein